MSIPDLTRYDVIFGDGENQQGYVVSWEGDQTETFVLVTDEQTVPEGVVRDQEDENYGFHDLLDTWRMSFTNFVGGEGQPRRDVSDGASSKYDRSLLVDNSTEGQLSLHHTMRQLKASNCTWIMSPSCLAVEWQGAVIFANVPQYVAGFSNRQLSRYDPVSGSWARWGLVDNGLATVAAMCSDGDKLYVAFNGGSVYASQGIWSFDTDCWGYIDAMAAGLGRQVTDPTDALSKAINRLCYSGGVLYAVSGNRVGYIAGTTDGAKTFAEISADLLIKPMQTSFGLVGDDQFAYWGVNGGEQSRVYQVQRNLADSSNVFGSYAKFPAGFVGTSMTAYVGLLFVCGYYRDENGSVGQGAVYVVSENGTALLTKIGPEAELLIDEEDYRVLACYGYDHWLYLLTPRSLYRWDIRRGGLNHVAEVGTFSASDGDPGSLLVTPWDTERSYWPGYTHEAYLGALDATQILPSVSNNRISYIHQYNYTSIDLVPLKRNWSDTGNKYGDRTWLKAYIWSIPDGGSNDYGDFTHGGVAEAQVSHCLYSCFEMSVASPTRKAHIALYGRPNDDEVRVYYMDSSGSHVLGGTYAKKTDSHTIYLACDSDSGYATVWVDGSQLCRWVMPTSAYYPGLSYTIGNHDMSLTSLPDSVQAMDWTVSLRYLRWAAGSGYPPNWSYAAGVIPAGSFPVISGSPYIPAYTGVAETNALLAFDWDAYPRWDPLDLNKQIEGTLWTSVSASRMPTVRKYVTTLDVHHEPLKRGETLLVTPYIDTGIQPTLELNETNGQDRVSSLDLYGASGSEMQLKVQLRGPGTTTPVFRGASLRFSPVDNSYYILRLDLRESRRDNAELPIDTAAAFTYLKEMAESKRVVTMQTAVETCRVRVANYQMLISFGSRDDEVKPQGIVMVKLKRVQ